MRIRRLISFAALGAALALAACGDDATGTADGSGGGGGLGSDPGAGPANEVDAEVSGGSAAGSVDGESETSAEGQYYGALLDGTLSIVLASNGGVIAITAEVRDNEVPGSVAVDRTLGQNATVTYTTPMGIFEGNGGTITVNQCPNEAGVITGTFNNIPLVNVATESGDGSLSGDWRVTIASSDASATCVEIDTGGGGGGGGGATCENEVCDGPCCPYVQPLANCQFECIGGCLANPQACVECMAGCPEEVGMLDDAECSSAWQAAESCADAAGCDVMSDDYDACTEANCCDEFSAAF